MPSKKKLSPEEKIKKREDAAFRRKIISVFKNIKFEYLNTEGIHRRFGLKKGELDYVFLYENIILVCEDTTTTGKEKIKEHLKNKKILTDEIRKDKSQLISWLKESYSDNFSKFDDYSDARYQIFHLYFTKNRLDLSDDDKKLYGPLIVVEHSSLNYFHKIAQNIKYSARNEIFRFLHIHCKSVGTSASASAEDSIETTIIYPNDNTGLKNGVRLVSFMMSAEKLLRNCYVLRKDNWEDSIQLYQRLIEKGRIQSIRKYLAIHKSTFFNNIIVGLPGNVTFKDKDGNPIVLDDIHEFENCKMVIPNEFNSICVIDGQHRIFAHYEGPDDFQERAIRPLRKKLHLLVTGLIFPRKMGSLDRRKYESQIFLDINSNAKAVPPDVLLHIKTLRDPFSSIGIARQVLEKLNKEQVFLNFFQLSLMEKSIIKIASIIKFALKYIVEIDNASNKETFYNYWDVDKRAALAAKDDEEALKEYVTFVANHLAAYFSALRDAFKSDWQNNDSKILSTTSINGFIMALRRSLRFHGLEKHEFYLECFKKLDINFSKVDFNYTSSQYNKFSKQILKECFDLIEDDNGEWQLASTK
jgi:DGQHR domain-containing protein